MLNPVARDQRATSVIGAYRIKTAGGIMISSARLVLDGWLYASPRHLLFLSDSPLSALSPSYPGLIDLETVLLPISERPSWNLVAPFFTPNGIIEFTDGVELVGQKSRIKQIAKMLEEST
jgi:hypothetical protein